MPVRSSFKLFATAICGAMLLLQSCVKDTVTRRYTLYKPVYNTRDAVINNIQSNAPAAIQKTGKIFFKDNYLFLNDVNRGVHIIDYRDPANPVKVAFITIPGNVDMAVRGNTLYVDCYTSLIALDISNPLQVQRTKVINGVFPERSYYGFVGDSSKVIVDWQKIDTTVSEDFNVDRYKNMGIWSSIMLSSNSSAGMFASVGNGAGGSMARFALLNNRLYTVSHSNIRVFNTTTPATPNYVADIASGVFDIETIYPFGHQLFLGSNTGMHIFSVTNPNAPSKTGTFSHARVCDPVIAEQNTAYITLRSGTTCQGFTNQLDVVNITNLSNPTLIKSYTLVNPHGLSKDGDILYICDGPAGFKMFNAANPQNIQLLKTFSNLEPYDVIARNSYAWVVAKDGLYCFKYNNNSTNDISIISKVSIN